MKKIRTLLVLLCTVFLFLPAQAERVNIEKAEKVARSYARTSPRLAARRDFRHTRTVSKRVQRNVPGLRSAPQQDEPMYHVFTLNGSGGFIIIAGDDVARPVLGYADEGTFDESNENLAYWLETLAQEIAAAIESNLSQDAETKAAWEAFESENNLSLRASGDYVDPLVKTKWNQNAPYWNQCPNQWYTGCVATAMAQIMKYHSHPAQGTGSHSYSHSTIGTISANFGSTAYNWSAMTNTYTSSATGAAATAVATLMYHCGVSVDMNYGPGGSGANSSKVPNALVTYFGYDPGTSILSRNLYPHAEWINLLKTELKAGRPVYYSGQGSGGGHAFVCDGYDTDDLFHFNWGWGGSSDGYFEISALNPRAIGIGGGSGGYNTGQDMIIGIRKSAGGSLPPMQLGLSEFSLNSSPPTQLSNGTYLNVAYTKLTNTGSVPVTASLGIWIYSQDDVPVAHSLSSSISGLNPGYYYTNPISLSCKLPGDLPEGTYRLYPAFQANNQSTPSIIPGENGNKYIAMTVGSGKSLTFSGSSSSAVAPTLTLKTLTVDGNLYQGKVGNIMAEIENAGTGDYNAKLMVKLGSVALATDPAVIPAGTTKTVKFSGTVSLSPATYSATVWYDPDNVQDNSPGTQLGSGTNVAVQTAPSEASSLSCTNSFASGNTNAPQNAPGLTVTLKNTGGLFQGNVIVYIFPSSGGSSIGTFGSVYVSIDKNETKAIQYNDPLDFLTPGSYRFGVYAASSLVGTTAAFTLTAPVYSSDATLKTLTVKDAQTQTTLTGGHITVSSGTTAYTVDNVDAAVTHVSIIGEASEPRAKFGNIENAILTGSSTTFNIEVTADDKTTKKTYTVTVKRASTAQYGVNTGTFTGGSVSSDNTSYVQGATVTLTVTADTGYELDVISAYQHDGSNTAVALNGSGNTRTFTMPAYAVTVTATFKKTAAKLLAEAKTLVEAATYTVAEETANTENGVKAQVAARINALPGISETGIEAVAAGDISTSGFTAADMGTNGAFNFTAKLKKNGSEETTASISATITALPVYTVTVGSAAGGSITQSASTGKYHASEQVTLTASPGTGYELKDISAHKTGDTGTPVSVTKTDATTCTFTMPAYDVTATPAFQKTADQLAVEAAKSAINGASYTVAQASAGTADEVKTWLAGKLTGLAGAYGTVAASDITVSNFSVATAGTESSLSGTPGSFGFSVKLKKNSSTEETAGKTNCTITATPAYAITVNPALNGSVAAQVGGSPVTAATAGATINLVSTPATDWQLKTLSVYRTGDPTAVVLAGTGTSFTMPDYGVTVAAEFEMTPDRKAVETAKEAIEGSSFAIAQASAADVSAIAAWLGTQIGALSGVNGTSVTVSNITVSGFTAATAGSSVGDAGTNGAFSFTAQLQNGSSQTVTTTSVSGTITATPYVPVSNLAVSISGTTNGSVSSSPSGSATEGQTVTLTVTPAAGYELNELKVYKTSGSENVAYTSGSAGIYTFTMPDKAVTVEATFRKTATLEAVETALTAVQNYVYNVPQDQARNQDSVEVWLKKELATILEGTGVTVTTFSVSAFTAATAGAAGDLDGSNGSFTFTVTLKKDDVELPMPAPRAGTVTATPAYSIAVDSDITNGSVTGPLAALAGETVTLTVTPATGYETEAVAVCKTSDMSTLLTPAPATGNDWTFTMPAVNVTATATFRKTAALTAEETARSLIEGATYTVPQTTANTDAAVKTWLAGQINALPGMSATGITVTESDITIGGGTVTAAQDGKTASQPNGTPGSFTFTVMLSLAGTTDNVSGTITPTPAYTVTVSSGITNGTVTPSASIELQGQTVTLNVTPGTGYEPDVIKAYPTGNASALLSLTVAGNSRSFVMPAHDVTVEATFRKTAGQTALEEARKTVENATYTVAQTTANTATDVKTWLDAQIAALLTGTSITASGLTVSAFTAAETGTEGSPAGVNGSFSFTLTLTNSAGATLTAGKSGTVKATPYTAPSTYILTVESSTGGTVTADQYASITEGTGITLQIQPGAGYELSALTVHKTGDASTTVSYGGTGNTRSFLMPAHDVTVKAAFAKTAGQVAVESARSILEGSGYSVAQATANAEAQIKTWLATEINSRISSTGVTVQASDITVGNFTAATAGTAASPSGTNGNFDFTVNLEKDGSNLTTSMLSGTITATGYAVASYTVTIAPATGGTVAASPSNPVGQGATVTLTVTPGAGYVLSSISACKTGDPGITVALSVATATTRTFTMPGCDVTVTAVFTPTADQAAVEAAESLIPATFTVPQGTANTQTAVQSWLKSQIDALIATTGATAAVTVSGFTAATAGAAATPSGANGSFTFTVALTKGTATLNMAARTGTVTATPYGSTPYTVTVSSTGNGTVTVSPSGPLYAGNTVTLSISPSSGYSLSSIRAYRTGSSLTQVTLGGSGNTRTFAMPAYNVTVEAVFLTSSQAAAQRDVDNARYRIENATFSVPQATANTQTAVRTWLAQQINTLIASTGVTVTASDITVGNFTVATAGTTSSPLGANGSYTFTVSLTKNGASAVTSAKTGQITASAYTVVQYAITVGASSGGSVKASVTSAPTGATVTLTATPNAGYELDSIRAYRTGAAATAVALSGSGGTRTFVMPAYAVTVAAAFKKTQEQIDRETVEAAKISVEGGTYRIAQATGNTETAVKSWLIDVLGQLLYGRNVLVTFRSGEEDVLVADATLTSFTPAVGGTEANPSGTDGSYRFTVILTKGGIHVETLEVDGVIVAMPYAATPVKRIELLSLGETRVRIINTGNVETGGLTLALSGTNVDVFTLPSATSGSLSVGGEEDFLLIPREDLTPGTYKVTVTVDGEGLTPVSLEITWRVLPVGNEAVAGSRVWASGGMLYIAAATTGEARVFGTDGRLVKAIPHTAGETVATALPQGFHIVTAEGKVYKVMIR
jgi:hypothetical protein